MTAAESDLAVETAGLSKRFGRREVIRGVDLCVPRGAAFGYLGPTGWQDDSDPEDRAV